MAHAPHLVLQTDRYIRCSMMQEVALLACLFVPDRPRHQLLLSIFQKPSSYFCSARLMAAMRRFEMRELNCDGDDDKRSACRRARLPRRRARTCLEGRRWLVQMARATPPMPSRHIYTRSLALLVKCSLGLGGEGKHYHFRPPKPTQESPRLPH